MKNKIEIKGDVLTLTADNGTKVRVRRCDYWALRRAMRQSNALYYEGSDKTETLNIPEGKPC